MLENFNFNQVLDFIIIGLISFKLLQMIKGTRAMSIFTGLVILAITLVISNFLKLNWTHKVLTYFFDHFLLIIIVLFQEEIRRTLADMGRKASGLTYKNKKVRSVKDISEAIAYSVTKMGQEKIGALIVLERNDKLQNLIDTGSQINAQVKSELMYAIFLKESPIHDGAIVISSGELTAAGCILPLSKDPSLNKQYGTRHRAAIGLTEETDSVVVVVSEETGTVSVVKDGKVTANLSELELKEALILLQVDNQEVAKKYLEKAWNFIKLKFKKD